MASHSAAYGQASLGFKTKCKCIPRPKGNGYERCHRLKRLYHPADTLRRSAKKQSSSDAHKVVEGTEGSGTIEDLYTAPIDEDDEDTDTKSTGVSSS
ncbi:hypothetical protein N7527_010792 [Penicillium freii]|nr:hypothetical protein N7527_010792 [Penicillium freii]